MFWSEIWKTPIGACSLWLAPPSQLFYFWLWRYLWFVKELRQTKTDNHVTSDDAHNIILMIVFAKTRYALVFCQPFDAPPIQISSAILAQYGCSDGYCALCLEQDGELWRSSSLHHTELSASSVLDYTGSDSASKNVKVKCFNCIPWCNSLLSVV